MDKEKAKKLLEDAAKDDPSRSNPAKLRELFDDLETALEAGVRRSAIIEILNTAGLQITLGSFDQAMYRIRKKRGKTKSLKSITSQDTPKPRSQNPTPATPRRFEFNPTRDPKDLI